MQSKAQQAFLEKNKDRFMLNVHGKAKNQEPQKSGRLTYLISKLSIRLQ